MNYEIKNTLERLLSYVDQIENVVNRNGKSSSLKDSVIEDIFSFITGVTKNDSEARLQLFNIVYLNGKYDFLINKQYSDFSQKSFQLIQEMCITAKDTSTFFNHYLGLIVRVSQYYLTTRSESKNTESEKVFAYIKSIQEKIEQNNKMSVSDKANKIQSKETNAGLKQELDTVQEEAIPEKSLEELLLELNSLIGLNGVKKEVKSLINMIKVNNLRKSRGIKTADVSKHLVFLGNPGTGKTTVARLISSIYKQLGLLEKGHLVEVDRSGLVAGYVGQTALKTKEKIEEAMGGTLFVDEAYTLAKGDNDFGQEAIDTILKAMEDNRDKFIVIVAGYPEPMERFLESNPGLKSRFNKTIEFEDYSEDELYSIFEGFCSHDGMKLHENAKEYVKGYINSICNAKTANFANGREMRNLFEKALANQMNRVAEICDNEPDISDEVLMEIRMEDFQ